MQNTSCKIYLKVYTIDNQNVSDFFKETYFSSQL